MLLTKWPNKMGHTVVKKPPHHCEFNASADAL